MSKDDLQLAVDTIEGRQKELIKAERYYNGDVDEVFASPKLRRALQRTGTSFRINFARVPVDAVLNRLEISTVHVGDSLAREIIETTWVNNELDMEVNEVHRSALIYGDSFFMIWLDDEGPDEEPDIVATYESPRNMCMFYHDENPRRKKFAAKMWTESNGDTRVNLYYPETIEKWVKKKKNKTFTELESEENPFGVIPVFHFRTRRPYGRPEHKDAWGIQDMINKIVVTQMATNDYQGFPLRVALANPDEAGGSSDFDDFNEDTGQGDNIASLSSGPGEVWYLKGIKEIAQFDAADPNSFLAPLREYIKAMAATTDTPIHMFEGLQGSTSGEHIRAAESPLNKKVKNRQVLFSKTWDEVFNFILALFDMATVQTSVQWAPIETMNTKEAWETALLKRDMGVPLHVILAEQGYTETEIEMMIMDAEIAAGKHTVGEIPMGDEADELLS